MLASREHTRFLVAAAVAVPLVTVHSPCSLVVVVIVVVVIVATVKGADLPLAAA